MQKNLRKFWDLKKFLFFATIIFFYNKQILDELFRKKLVEKLISVCIKFFWKCQNFLRIDLHYYFYIFFSQIILHHYSTTYMYQRTHVYTYYFCVLYSLTVLFCILKNNSLYFYFMKIFIILWKSWLEIFHNAIICYIYIYKHILHHILSNFIVILYEYLYSTFKGQIW